VYDRTVPRICAREVVAENVWSGELDRMAKVLGYGEQEGLASKAPTLLTYVGNGLGFVAWQPHAKLSKGRIDLYKS